MNLLRTRTTALAAFAGACLSFATFTSQAQADILHRTTFDNGTEGWSVSGRDNISLTGGNPGANMDVEVLDVFGISIRNETNANFLGDYSRYGSYVRLGVDVKINSIWMLDLDGNQMEVWRDLVVELVDYNDDPEGFPYTSVWFHLGEIAADLPGWRRFEVSFDPTSSELPPGWGGTGAEDPDTFEPILPPDRTFADVLANVDELRFTSFVPGWFFAFTNFELQVDNPTLTTVVPEPSGAAVLAMGACLLLRRRRRPSA